MPYNNYCNRLMLLLLFSSGFLAGCVGTNSLPQVARGGDSVVFAVGSPEGMTRDNITVTYTPDSGTGGAVDLTPNIRALFNLYPDPTSSTALGGQSGIGSIYSSGHEPWLTSLAIDLPSVMPVGTGKVNVECVPRTDCVFPFLHPHINDVDISLEIIEGTGSANPFGYKGQFGSDANAQTQYLERLPQVVVLPDPGGSVGDAKYGAANIELNIPVETSDGGAVRDSDIFVIAEDITFSTGSQRSVIWKRSGDVVNVMLVSPLGMTYREIRFSIVLRPPLSGSTVQPHVYSGTPALLSEVYYDLDGNEVPAGFSPQVSVVLNN